MRVWWRECACAGESSEVGEGERGCECGGWGPRSVCERERASWAFVNVGAPAADED